MTVAALHVDRKARTATVALRGDVVIATAQPLYGELRALVRRRDVRNVTIDFAGAGRIDTSAVALISIIRRALERAGKRLELVNVSAAQRGALALIDEAGAPTTADDEPAPGRVERVGAWVIAYAEAAAELGGLVADVAAQAWEVARRRKQLPRGALVEQISRMGVDGLPIVALLGGLLGTTLAFQGVVLLHRFGAGQYVADMIGVSLVRELGPMMTAIVLTGRTGAAIAAELGTMRVRSELDALSAMGVSPTRFLLLPRLAALSIVEPALTLVAMFVGIGGGMLVTSAAIHVPPAIFWARIIERVDLMDFAHGLVKSFVFAWVIGLTACHFGMRAAEDATSVGVATTRTVVVAVSFIILIDAVAATIAAGGI